MGNTSIQWTDKTWSPIRSRVRANAAAIAARLKYSSLVQIAEKMAGHVGPHCEKVSEGCENCYSQTNNHRCLPANGTGLLFDRRSRDLVETFVDEFILRNPLDWKKPVKVFVENQSDLFGEWVTDEQIDQVFAVMALRPTHTFQVLTKRPERMKAYMARRVKLMQEARANECPSLHYAFPNFLPNVWLGVSVEDQKTADFRIPLLMETPAAIRFVSYEPALDLVDFRKFLFSGVGSGRLNRLHWIIFGGESGAGSRPLNIRWIRRGLRDCSEAGVAAFVKQLGRKAGTSACADIACTHPDCGPTWLNLKDPKGGDPAEWPEDLRVRQFPEASQ